MYCTIIVALVVALTIGTCSGQCDPPTEADLEHVIAQIIQAGDSAALPTIDLMNFKIVCRAVGEEEGTLRQVSVVVEYNCTGHARCPEDTVIEQIETQCSSGTWGITVQGGTDGIRLESPEATLTTPGRDNCSVCLSPRQASVTGAPPPDPITHCIDCDSSCKGLGMCTGPGSGSCCNFYSNSMCVEVCPNFSTNNFTCVDACPRLFTNNSDNECVCQDGRFGIDCTELVHCDNLTDPENGRVNVPDTVFNSTAEYICNGGYTLIGVTSRRCLGTGLWSGGEPRCEVDCGELLDPDNGKVMFSTTILGSIANYSCNDGYARVGDLTRMCERNGEWSGKEPTCTACAEANCLICPNKPEECTVCEENYETVDGACKCEVDGCAVCDTGKCDECEGSMRFDEASVSCVTQDDGGDKDGGLPAGAIAGIILALIVMALILALTAALIGYFAKRHWDKVHTRSHNIPSEQPKESHENPLYVGPETALEGVDKGTAVLIGGNGVSPSEGGVSNGVSNGSE